MKIKSLAKSIISNRFLKAALPKKADFSFMAKIFVLFLIGFTFFQIFSYTTKVKAVSDNRTSFDSSINDATSYNSVMSGRFAALTQALFPALLECKTFSPAAKSEGLEGNEVNYSACMAAGLAPQSTTGFIQKDLGPVGRFLNSGQAMIQTRVASPGLPSYYYASKITGKTSAASPTSGNEVLSPMFTFSRAMRNLAYGIVVIILVISALSSLLSYLGNGEQKVTLIQLMLNTGITLFFITFFYNLAAIVYDLTVNYGNAIVAATLEPYINARIILDRLGPGGDLTVGALLNVFEFAGVSQGIITVANNVFYSIKPAIVQSIDAFTNNLASQLPLGSQAGFMFSIAGGAVSYLISGVISSVLGSAAIFDALIAFVIFFLNLKIWLNLLTSFLAFNMYMGFGPIMVLSGIGGGYDKIKNTFKNLFAFGLVFPLTFLCILLGAIMMNFYIPKTTGGVNDNPTTVGDRDQSLLCVYEVNDPVATEPYLATRTGTDWLRGRLGPGVVPDFNDDPSDFRKENTEFQDIFDVTPKFFNENGTRACRSSLFPDPWTFLPAPMGNYGNRGLQIQTTDILIRTIIGIAFLIVATRAPDLLKELLGVEQLNSLKGLGGAFKAGLKPLVGSGAIGFGVGGNLLLGAGKLGLGAKLPFIGWAKKPLQTLGYKMQGGQLGESLGFASVSDLYGKFKGGYSFRDAAGMYKTHADALAAADPRLAARTAGGFSPAEMIAFQNVGQAFGKLAGSSNFLSDAFGSLTNSLVGVIKAFDQMGTQIGKFTAITSIDDI